MLAATAWLAGCAGDPVLRARAPRPVTAPALAAPRLTDLATVAGTPRYAVIDRRDPALTIPASVFEPPSNAKSFLPDPNAGRISQDTWQRARIQDGRVIDACVADFAALAEQFKAFAGAVR